MVRLPIPSQLLVAPSGERPRSRTQRDLRREPRLVSGPFTRWPRAADTALAVAVLAASVVAVSVNNLENVEDFSPGSIADLPISAYLILTGLAGTLYFRRRDAVIVVALIISGLIVWRLLDYAEGQDLALVIGTYSLGRYATNEKRARVVIALACITTAITGGEQLGRSIEVVGSLVFTLLPWYIGKRIRNRGDYMAMLQDRATHLEREQHSRAREAVTEERARIARELHDVVAHRVSMMTVQAGAARTVAHVDADAAAEAMMDVERAGRQALGELRHLLGVLRAEGSRDHNEATLGPQPGIADLPQLVDRLCSAGIGTTLNVGLLPEELPAPVELSVYRIVQECLTNVLKHGGLDATAAVEVNADSERLTIEVLDTGSGTSTLPRSGYGIDGMRERAQLLGGSLDAAPRDGRGFRVTVHLPLESEAT